MFHVLFATKIFLSCLLNDQPTNVLAGNPSPATETHIMNQNFQLFEDKEPVPERKLYFLKVIQQDDEEVR